MLDRSDTRPIFRDDYISKKIFFPAEQELWTLTEKLNEKQVQYSYYGLPPQGPSYTCGTFRCERSYPSDLKQTATMKIWMQLPFDGPQRNAIEERATRATSCLPYVIHNATFSLLSLALKKCKSCPTALGYKKERQDDNGLIPGGFIVYIIISDIPGVRLDKTMYQEMSLAERQEICEAFKEAWLECIKRGVYIHQRDIRDLSWDSVNKKIYITNFEGWRQARANEYWEDVYFSLWGLKTPRSDYYYYAGPNT